MRDVEPVIDATTVSVRCTPIECAPNAECVPPEPAPAIPELRGALPWLVGGRGWQASPEREQPLGLPVVQEPSRILTPRIDSCTRAPTFRRFN